MLRFNFNVGPNFILLCLNLIPSVSPLSFRLPIINVICPSPTLSLPPILDNHWFQLLLGILFIPNKQGLSVARQIKWQVIIVETEENKN